MKITVSEDFIQRAVVAALVAQGRLSSNRTVRVTIRVEGGFIVPSYSDKPTLCCDVVLAPDNVRHIESGRRR